MPNALARSTSPYLLQHADNPVDWREWGDEAFAEAARRDVPVLLSVGYAACHWCHVMAHESFEDPAVAAVVDAGFVAVKVDREERPDVDAAYMAATTALTGQGGWPMTVFLRPDGSPFHAGTYHPPVPVGGRPSFTQVLAAVRSAWTERRAEVDRAAEGIAAALAQRHPTGRAPRPVVEVDAGADEPAPPGPAALEAAVAALAREEDVVHGGFGGAPKFPPSPVLGFLLRHAGATTATAASREVAAGLAGRALDAMIASGTYDQLAGGFARYAVDAAWRVPHFEKMLYDNAQLARAALHRWRLDGDPASRRVALETCEWVLDALGTGEGALASSLDADTLVDGRAVEGATYVWTPRQLVEVLGAQDGAWAAELLDVTAAGSFEHGTSTLVLTRDPWAGGPAEAERWTGVRERLREARAARAQPARDDKVVAAWNGLALAALAETGALCGRADLVAAAERAADLLLRVHRRGDGSWRRTSRDGVVGEAPAVLEDLGCVAEGLLALHAVTGRPRWARAAEQVLDQVLDRFAEGGVLHDTAADAQDPRLALMGRPADPADAASPSGASAAAGALLTWSALSGSARHRRAAQDVLAAAAALAGAAPRFAGWALAVAQAAAEGPVEVAVAGGGGTAGDDGDGAGPGGAGGAGVGALALTALAGTSPGLVVARPPAGGGDGAGERVPLLEHRDGVAGRPAAYVCRDMVCRAPTTSVDELARQVGARAPAAPVLPAR